MAEKVDALGIQPEASVEDSGTVIRQKASEALGGEFKVEAVFEVGVLPEKVLAGDFSKSLFQVFFHPRLFWAKEKDTEAFLDFSHLLFGCIQGMLEMLLEDLSGFHRLCPFSFVEGHSERDSACLRLGKVLECAPDEFNKGIERMMPQRKIGFMGRNPFSFLKMLVERPDIGPLDFLLDVYIQKLLFEEMKIILKLSPFACFYKDGGPAVIGILGDELIGSLLFIFSGLIGKCEKNAHVREDPLRF